MIYTFPADHPFTIKMLRGALITLLGRPAEFIGDNELAMCWSWKHDGVFLSYYLSSTLAGQSVIATRTGASGIYKGQHKHDQLFQGWLDAKEKPAD